MQLKRALLCLSLAVLLTPVSGCKYLRLWEAKRQLADFDRFFKLENRNGLCLISLKPVLLTQDILFLAKRAPTHAEGGAGHSVWRYQFIKQVPDPDAEEGAFDVPVDLVFQENRLCMGTLPERFDHFIPRALMVEAFRALGRAAMHPLDRSVRGTVFVGAGKRGIPLPQSHDFVKLLGRPFREQRSGDLMLLHYVYRLKGVEQGSTPSSDARAQFTFSGGGEKLVKLEATFAGMKLSLSFDGEKDLAEGVLRELRDD